MESKESSRKIENSVLEKRLLSWYLSGLNVAVDKKDTIALYRARDKLVEGVNQGYIKKKSLYDFILNNRESVEAGMASTVLYLTSRNFGEMRTATDVAFKERYGFLAVTGEINEIYGSLQAMFADVDYTEENGSGFRNAKRIGEIRDSHGDCAANAEDLYIKNASGLRGDVLTRAKGVEIERLEDCEGFVLAGAKDIKVSRANSLRGNVLAEAEDVEVSRASGLEENVLTRTKRVEIERLEDCGGYVLAEAEDIEVSRASGLAESVLTYTKRVKIERLEDCEGRALAWAERVKIENLEDCEGFVLAWAEDVEIDRANRLKGNVLANSEGVKIGEMKDYEERVLHRAKNVKIGDSLYEKIKSFLRIFEINN